MTTTTRPLVTAEWCPGRHWAESYSLWSEPLGDSREVTHGRLRQRHHPDLQLS